MLLLSRCTLWLGGLGFIGFGLYAMLLPLQMLGQIGVAVSGGVAAVEIRAFYGGLELALGALLLSADWQPHSRRHGLLLAMAAYGGIGLARGLGMLMADVATPFLWLALGTELTLALLAAICWRATTRLAP